MVQTPVGAKSNPWIVYMKECRAHYNEKKSESNLTSGAVEARKAMAAGPKAKRNQTKRKKKRTERTKQKWQIMKNTDTRGR